MSAFSRRLFLLGCDVALFYGALFFVLALRYGDRFSEGLATHLAPFTLLLFGAGVVWYVAGLYEARNLKNSEGFFTLLFTALGVQFVLALALFYMVPWSISPRANLFFFMGVFALALTAWRFYFNRIAARSFTQAIIVLGYSKEIEEMVHYLEGNPQIGYTVAAWLREGFQDAAWYTIERAVLEERVSLIVVPAALQHDPALAKKAHTFLARGVRAVPLSRFYEEALGRVPLSEFQEIWFLDRAGSKTRGYAAVKRAADFMFACILSVVLLPVFFILSLAVALTSRGPIIYAQRRAGKDERPFTLYKFRSMRTDAEKGGAQWATARDPRMTKIGGFLRATHLDELPQLWNIIKGEISFVGPRPERPEFVTDLKKAIPYYELRHAVRPGLTGWAQINYPYGASVEDAERKLQYDLYYIKHRTFVFDLLVALKTVKYVFTHA